MKCLFKVLGNIIGLPFIFALFLITAPISIIMILSGCVDEEDTPVVMLAEGVDKWRQL